MSIKHFWIYVLIAIPVVPRVRLLSVGNTPILIDDFLILCCVIWGIIASLSRSAVTGYSQLAYGPVGVAFTYVWAYKLICFCILALFLPWIHAFHSIHGVVFFEGLQVVFKTLVLFLIYILLVSNLRKREDSLSALQFMVFCIFLVVLVGLLQFFVLGHTGLTSTFRNIYALSISSAGWHWDDPWFDDTLVGHEHFGAFLVLSLSFLTGLLLWRYPKNTIQRLLYTLLGIGGLFCFIYSSSRGAWIGGACSFFVILYWIMSRGQLVRLLTVSFYLILFISATVYVLEIDFVSFVGQRMSGLLTVLDGEITDPSAVDRLHQLGILWQRYLESPLWGWGAGGGGRVTEGQYMRELMEGGIVGFILFISFLFYCIRISVMHFRNSVDPLVKGSSLGLIAGIIGIAVQSIFTELFILTKIGSSFWVLLGIVHSMAMQNEYKPA